MSSRNDFVVRLMLYIAVPSLDLRSATRSQNYISVVATNRKGRKSNEEHGLSPILKCTYHVEWANL